MLGLCHSVELMCPKSVEILTVDLWGRVLLPAHLCYHSETGHTSVSHRRVNHRGTVLVLVRDNYALKTCLQQTGEAAEQADVERSAHSLGWDKSSIRNQRVLPWKSLQADQEEWHECGSGQKQPVQMETREFHTTIDKGFVTPNAMSLWVCPWGFWFCALKM